MERSPSRKPRLRNDTTHVTCHRFYNDSGYFVVVFCNQLFNGGQVVIGAG